MDKVLEGFLFLLISLLTCPSGSGYAAIAVSTFALANQLSKLTELFLKSSHIL